MTDAAEAGWPSALGRGRPGWHIECSAFCRAMFGDVPPAPYLHSGGRDLRFPHHENEIAQSQALFDSDRSLPSPFAVVCALRLALLWHSTRLKDAREGCVRHLQGRTRAGSRVRMHAEAHTAQDLPPHNTAPAPFLVCASSAPRSSAWCSQLICNDTSIFCLKYTKTMNILIHAF